MIQLVALIIGGAIGIGKETAKILAAKGAIVYISGRRSDIGEEAVAEIRATAAGSGGDAFFVQNDVGDEEAVASMFSDILSRHGRLDMAVNNAGINTESKTLADSDTQAFRAMLETNVLGVYHCMKLEIRQMLAQGHGSIVNLASIAGLNGIPWTGTYAATKHAVVGLTKSAALDHATQNVRINAIAPGAIHTDIIDASIALGVYDASAIAAIHPMQRMGRPEEVARAICWLLSDEASFVTGHIMNIDGGFQAK